MSKTAKEWFEQLPEPYRTQALENCTSDYEDISLSEAIFGGFVWQLTPQGNEYWLGIRNRAKQGEFDMPQPNLHGWIPVSERLPEEVSENYLVVKNGIVDISLFRGDWNKFHCDLQDFQEVTHWQPLPKLPEKL
jgi:hypothetical protein